jgi:hypothetical protein
MAKGKKGHKQASHLGKLLDLFGDDFQAIDGHPMVVIASGGVRRGLEAIVGWRFAGHPGIPRNMVKAAATFENALDLLKESLVLVTIDRLINRTCLSRDSRPKRAAVSRGIISQHPFQTLAPRHIRA